jgi:hypothetical protein
MTVVANIGALDGRSGHAVKRTANISPDSASIRPLDGFYLHPVKSHRAKCGTERDRAASMRP